DRADPAAHDDRLRNHVRLAVRRAAALVEVDLDVRAAQDHAWVERQILLAPDLFVEAVQDPRGLEDRARANAWAEDPRRVRATARDPEPPVARASTRDHCVFRRAIGRAALEAERDVAPL